MSRAKHFYASLPFLLAMASPAQAEAADIPALFSDTTGKMTLVVDAITLNKDGFDVAPGVKCLCEPTEKQMVPLENAAVDICSDGKVPKILIDKTIKTLSLEELTRQKEEFCLGVSQISKKVPATGGIVSKGRSGSQLAF